MEEFATGIVATSAPAQRSAMGIAPTAAASSDKPAAGRSGEPARTSLRATSGGR